MTSLTAATFSEEPFRIPRTILARIAAEQYVRAFWWFVIIPPLFGVICLFSGSSILQSIGVLGVLWPTTIPARAIFTTRKAARLFCKPVTVRLEDGTLYFFGTNGGGMKLSLASIRKIEVRNRYVLLAFGIGEFAAIPVERAPELNDLIELANSAREPVRHDSDIPS